jgi:hypothetical protein
MAKIYQIALAVLMPLSFAAAQQTITLNDGTQFQGRFTGGTPDLINFVDQAGQRHHFSVNQIQSILFTGGPAPAAAYNNAPPNGGYAPAPDATAQSNPPLANYPPPNYPPPNPAPPDAQPQPYTAANQSGYAPPPQPYPAQTPADVPPAQPTSTYASLPAGTEIAVRTNEQIRTNHGDVGRRYTATIARDVLDTNGNIVIPRGSDARLVVKDAGDGQVSLDLQSVFVNGQRYFLNTMDVRAGNDRDGLGANKRTGTYVGGGAVLGTLLGAVAGGGRGAAIGALAGAVAGAGTEVLTRGTDVRVPAETMLRFRLDQPVNLYQ